MVAAITPAGSAYQLGGPIRPRRHTPILHAFPLRPEVRQRGARGMAVQGDTTAGSSRLCGQVSAGRAADLNNAVAALIGYASGHVTRRGLGAVGVGGGGDSGPGAARVPGAWYSPLCRGRAAGTASRPLPPSLELFLPPSPGRGRGGVKFPHSGRVRRDSSQNRLFEAQPLV